MATRPKAKEDIRFGLRCSTCKAPILWMLTGEEKKPMPVDPLPVDNGNIIPKMIEMTGHKFIFAHVMTKAEKEKLPEDEPTWQSHFASCPDAKQHRR